MALIVITGGIRSGKSAAARALAESVRRDGSPVTFAVFGRRSDAEMSHRISRHQAERHEDVRTIEVTDAAAGWLSSVRREDLLVVDCLGTALGLLMETAWPDEDAGGLASAAASELPPGFAEAVGTELDELVAEIADRDGKTVVVTNEVGLALVSGWASGRLFTDLLGRANRSLVSRADAAYLCVAGRLVSLADLPTDLTWPED
jgi:adenosylcobinamide kinase/adenosylcobinamide-phosphate guanylyltransferase